MKKIAAIDIGTNSMRLLLCHYDGQGFGSKQKYLITTRMGQGISANGSLSKDAINRNLQALKTFKQKADEFGAEQIIVIATSAVRDASNREEFISAANQLTGISVKVISGDEEANLGIAGVLCEEPKGGKDVLVIDIGGGSTELILGNSEGIKYSKSTNAGTVRMTEGFITSHPINQNEMELLNKALEILFEEPVRKLTSMDIQNVIAIGGTATTIAAIYHCLSIYKPDKVHNTVITIDYLRELFEKLSLMSLEQRYAVEGLQKERADVIPAGIAIMLHIMEALKLDRFTASENDNLEGAVIRYAHGAKIEA